LGTRLEDATPEELFNFYFTNTANKGFRIDLEQDTGKSGGGLNRLIELMVIADAMRSSDENKARISKAIPTLNLRSNREETDITRAGFSQAEADFFKIISGDASYFETLTFGNFDIGDIQKLETRNYSKNVGTTNAKKVPSLGNSKVLSNFTDAEKVELEKRTETIEGLILSGGLSEEATEKFRELKANNPDQYYKIIREFDLGLTVEALSGRGGAGYARTEFLSGEEGVANQFYEENGVSPLLGLEAVINYPYFISGVSEPTLISDLSTAMTELQYAKEREDFANKIRALGLDIQLEYMSVGSTKDNVKLKMEQTLETGKWKTLIGMPEYLQENPEVVSTFPDLPLETQWRIIREAQALKVLEGLAKEERIFDPSQNPDIPDLPAELQEKVNEALGRLTPEAKARIAAERAARLAEAEAAGWDR